VKLVPTIKEGTSADENGLLVLFDLSQSEQLKFKAAERELFSHIQMMRKAAKLELSDPKNVLVTVASGKEAIEEIVKKL